MLATAGTDGPTIANPPHNPYTYKTPPKTPTTSHNVRSNPPNQSMTKPKVFRFAASKYDPRKTSKAGAKYTAIPRTCSRIKPGVIRGTSTIMVEPNARTT